MTSRRLVPLLVAAAALLPVASAQAGQLKAGAAVTDITPASGGTTLGFVRPDITVKGVHTRLAARALVLDDGTKKVALLATDLGYPLDKESLVARLKDRGFTHESILYTGTHTHSGPGSLDPWQVEQLAEAIRLADDRRVPARAGWSNGRVANLGRNRSIEAYLANFGIEQFYGEGDERDAPGGAATTRDEVLRVLRVETTGGAPIAAWMESAVHLTTSTPAVDVWDSDLAGAAEVRLERAIGAVPTGSLRDPGFVALWSNGGSGDQMPLFDSFNPTATMDLLGRRVAREAEVQWRRAGRKLRADLPLDVRWTRVCYCGQEVEPGKRVDTKGQFGLPFLGGSEDGASIFHEPLATEGRRTQTSDPVQGRKIVVPVPTDVAGIHEREPEVQVVRIGDRLLLGAPGEPTVMMARRFVSAVHPFLPAGIEDVVVVGLSNDYLGYLTTPEEYEMQHYEGGHTVFGRWTSLLMRSTFVELTRALAGGTPAPAPSSPGGLGSTDKGTPAVGGGGPGTLVRSPSGTVERGTVVDVEWTGASGGVDRRLDRPTLLLERRAGGDWKAVDSDLALGFLWRETDGTYGARYDVPLDLAPGTYRTRVVSGGYDLPGSAFEVAVNDGIVPLGASQRRVRGGRWRVTVFAQNPKPDVARAVLHRERSPEGGRVVLRVAGRRRVARWDPALKGWTVVFTRRRTLPAGSPVVLTAGALRDGAGNTSGPAVTLRTGKIAPADWPPNMLVGGGRTPGVGGTGQFP